MLLCRFVRFQALYRIGKEVARTLGIGTFSVRLIGIGLFEECTLDKGREEPGAKTFPAGRGFARHFVKGLQRIAPEMYNLLEFVAIHKDAAMIVMFGKSTLGKIELAQAGDLKVALEELVVIHAALLATAQIERFAL